MGNPTMVKDYSDQKQRAAVCYSQARKARSSEEPLKFAAFDAHEVRWTDNGKLIFPLVAMTEGVRQAANSDHPELIEAHEIEASADLWDGFPLTLTHPRNANGDYVSASSVEASPFIIGHVENPRSQDGKLIVEAHLDLGKLTSVQKLHPDPVVRAEASLLRERIHTGDQIEVSAGYFTRIEPEEGVWDYEGESPQDYSGLQQEIDPDHIALLKTTQLGACCWADGCGAPRMSEKLQARLAQMEPDVTVTKKKMKKKKVKTKDPMPHDMQAASCSCHLADTLEEPVRVHFDGYNLVHATTNSVVYRDQGKFYEQQFVLNADGTAEFQPAISVTFQREGLRNNVTLDRDGSVKPAEGGEEGMMKVADNGTNTVTEIEKPKDPAPEPEPKQEPAATAQPEVVTTQLEPVAASAKPTFQDLLDAADPDLRYSINKSREQAQQRRVQLVAFLKANTRRSEDSLKAMSMADLDGLYEDVKFVADKSKPKREEKPAERDNEAKDYSGRGLSASEGGIDDDDRPYAPLPEPAFKIGSRPELVTRRDKTAA
jgi:hypothetical protein